MVNLYPAVLRHTVNGGRTTHLHISRLTIDDFTLIVITYIILKIMGMARLFPVIIFGGTLSVVVAIAGKSRSCS